VLAYPLRECARLMMAWSLLCCGVSGCSKSLPAPNPLPDLSVEDTAIHPDLPKSVLPPQLCVGLTPAEDKWLPEIVEETVVEEPVDAISSGDLEGVQDASLDGEFAEVVQAEDIFSDLPEGPEPPPAFPVDATNNDGSVEETSLDAALSDSGEVVEVVDPCFHKPATCSGAPMPSWELFDFQPRSCGYKATYGLDLYKGHVTVVALLASW
jgi:hypothetical protein